MQLGSVSFPPSHRSPTTIFDIWQLVRCYLIQKKRKERKKERNEKNAVLESEEKTKQKWNNCTFCTTYCQNVFTSGERKVEKKEWIFLNMYFTIKWPFLRVGFTEAKEIPDNLLRHVHHYLTFKTLSWYPS